MCHIYYQNLLSVIQIRVNRRTTLDQLKEKLVPLIGVPPTGFKVCRVYNNQQEYEVERLSDSLMAIPSESRVIILLPSIMIFSLP